MQLETNEAGLEQRLSSLQTQIEHLRQTSPSDPRALEQRLATLTEFGAEILRRWSATADRHGAAVSQFEAHLRELSDVGTHLQQDAAQRLRDLERIIQQEWDALRQLHDAPVKQLVVAKVENRPSESFDKKKEAEPNDDLIVQSVRDAC